MQFRLGVHKMAAAVALLVALGLTSSAALAGQLDGFAPVDLSNWKPRTAASAMALVEPLYRGHPEGLEGRPKLKIELRKEANALIIDIEQTGFLDDSVRGEKHRAIVVQSPKGWRLERLGAKRSCYRGGSKAWRTDRCS
jgi:hypothetical protein